MSANNYTDNPRIDNQQNHADQKRVESNRMKLTSIIKTVIVYRKQKLVDVLSSLSFADDHPEIMRLHDSLLPIEDDSLSIVGDLINFVFDNADVNVCTLTGTVDTWHALGGIACTATTESSVRDEPLITRCTVVRSAQEHGRFSQITIKTYRKKKCLEWRSALICPLESPKALSFSN